jgi:hypothetical protein
MNALLEKTAARTLERVVDSELAPVGTFTVRRALPARGRHAVGPWVFLDHFGPFRAVPGEDGVGPHPHAGIETVTYLLSGANEHRDSAGHHGIVGKGGVQWMTAGRGILHAERAAGDGVEPLHGIQLWTSLPRLLKNTAPDYQRIDAAAIPHVEREGVTVRVVAGGFESARGPARMRMPLFLWHVTLAPGAALEAALEPGFEAGLYVIDATAAVDSGTKVESGRLAVWAAGSGPIAFANAGSGALEAMVLGGMPAEGPLVFHGPFVMNSVEQVRAAEVAYRTGRMGQLDD